MLWVLMAARTHRVVDFRISLRVNRGWANNSLRVQARPGQLAVCNSLTIISNKWRKAILFNNRLTNRTSRWCPSVAMPPSLMECKARTNTSTTIMRVQLGLPRLKDILWQEAINKWSITCLHLRLAEEQVVESIWLCKNHSSKYIIWTLKTNKTQTISTCTDDFKFNLAIIWIWITKTIMAPIPLPRAALVQVSK